jgi:hypothetical protein
MEILLRGLLIGAGLLLASCAATDDKVQTTVDPQMDLARYRTYAFLEAGPKTEGGIMDKRVHDRLRHMIAVRLGMRGYVPAAQGQPADLGVHFSGKVVPKQSVLMVGRPGPYDYSWGRTELGGYDTLSYREGTLYLDLVDLAQNRLVWRTRVTEALSAGYSEDNWKKIERALDDAFERVPQRRQP